MVIVTVAQEPRRSHRIQGLTPEFPRVSSVEEQNSEVVVPQPEEHNLETAISEIEVHNYESTLSETIENDSWYFFYYDRVIQTPPSEEERPFPIPFPSFLDNTILGVLSNSIFSSGIVLTFMRARTRHSEFVSPTPIPSPIRRDSINTSEVITTSVREPIWEEPFLFP